MSDLTELGWTEQRDRIERIGLWVAACTVALLLAAGVAVAIVAF